VAEPVEERPDQRRDDRERDHGQAEEEQHRAALAAGRAGEEDRAGQGDRERRVTRGVRRVQLDQPVEAGAIGPLRARGAARLADGRRARAARDPAEAPDPAGGRLRAGTERGTDRLSLARGSRRRLLVRSVGAHATYLAC
jgi:hypothetical protein